MWTSGASFIMNGFTLHQALSCLELVGYALLLGIFIDGIYVGVTRGLKKSKDDSTRMTNSTPRTIAESSRPEAQSRAHEGNWEWPPTLTANENDKANGRARFDSQN